MPKAYHIFITTLVLYIFLVVTPLVAFSAPSPAANPLCWLKDTCKRDDGEFCNNDEKCPDEAQQCPGEWGFCYPAPAKLKTELQVPIGGYTTISNASQYIRTVYQVSLGVAVTAAIVVLMVAGFRYMTAAGNTSIIGQAKTMILSAIIGLVLLFGASLLFQTINPDIVKLTLPRFPKLRPQTLGSAPWCDQFFKDAVEAKRFASAGKAPNLKTSDKLSDSDFKDRTRGGMSQEDCGNGFYPLSDPSRSCYTRMCPPDSKKVCLLQTDASYECEEVSLGGLISAPGTVAEINLWSVCQDGEVGASLLYNLATPTVSATVESATDGKQSYYFKIKNEVKLDPNLCRIKGLKGYVLSVRLEGVSRSSLGVTYIAIKKNGNTCGTFPFSSKNDVYDLDEYLAGEPSSSFFQSDELNQGGLQCDISVST